MNHCLACWFDPCQCGGKKRRFMTKNNPPLKMSYSEELEIKLKKAREGLKNIMALQARTPDVIAKLGHTTTYLCARQVLEEIEE